jgi:hypothetical protein
MTKRIAAAVFFGVMTLALAGHGYTAEKKTGQEGPEYKQTAETKKLGTVNYRITFKITADILESSGTVIVLEGTNADYATRGDTAVYVGENDGKPMYSVKNFGAKARFRPLTDPKDANIVNLQSQLELLGPLALKGAGKQNLTVNLETFTRVTLGKPTVIMDTQDGRAEVTVEAVK